MGIASSKSVILQTHIPTQSITHRLVPRTASHGTDVLVIPIHAQFGSNSVLSVLSCAVQTLILLVAWHLSMLCITIVATVLGAFGVQSGLNHSVFLLAAYFGIPILFVEIIIYIHIYR